MQADTATICYVRSLIPLVEAGGLAEQPFLERLGIDRQVLTDVDARLPKQTVARAWQIAAEVTRNENVGLLASLHAPPGTFPVLDHLAANLPTVGHALRSIARYFRLCDPELVMNFELIPEGGALSLIFPRDDGRYSRHWSEWFVGFLLSRARSLSRAPDLRPLHVDFQHERPSDITTLTTLLGSTPAFSRPVTAISFSHATLRREIPEASAFLGRLITAHAERDLQLSSPHDQTSTRIKRALIETLDHQTPRIAAAARQSGCSVRTLQARLKKEGTSFEKLLDEARHQLALQYVHDDTIRLVEIPLLLQFSEPSPFHRAFRRWTGTTPLEYRRSSRGLTSLPSASSRTLGLPRGALREQ